MAPVPSRLGRWLVPGTGWESFGFAGGSVIKTGEGGIYIEPNADTTCFSIRSVGWDGDEDLIHFCDWPALRAVINQFMADRAAEEEEEL